MSSSLTEERETSSSSLSLLLEVQDLSVAFTSPRGNVRAVDGVSFFVKKGETLGVVGESGCGKSVTALSLLRLIPSPGRIESGSILFKGRDLLKLSEGELRRIRGSQISMIFQEPMTSLNPVYTVGEQIAEVFRLHQGFSQSEAWTASIEALQRVRLPDPERRAEEYPHQLSGGQRQRVMIAMALAAGPDLLLADEPTTALDVTIQAQILDLLQALCGEAGMSMALITHDLGIIAERADRVAVMYAGVIVESAPVRELFKNPLHPYTRGLLAAVPRLGAPRGRLADIPGTVPSPWDLPSGCRFAPRCPLAVDSCRAGEPDLINFSEGHQVRCPITVREAHRD